MRWLKRRADRAGDQLDIELHFHIERQVADYVRRGMSLEETTRRTMMEFGGIELAKEECRDLSVWTSIEQLWQDVCYAARTLSRSSGFTLAAVFSLALGIGARSSNATAVNSPTGSLIWLVRLNVAPTARKTSIRSWAPTSTSCIIVPRGC